MSEPFREKSSVLFSLLSLAVLSVLLAAACLVAARIWSESPDWSAFPRFWLKQGAEIGFTVTVISLVWPNLNEQHPDLISAHPVKYLRTCTLILSGVFLAFANSLPAAGSRNLADAKDEPSSFRLVSDTVVSLVFYFLLSIAALAWLLAVAPAFYFTTLLTGAPARLAMLTGGPTHELVTASPKGTSTSLALTLETKPVTLTAAITAGTFLLVNRFPSWVS